MQKHTFKSGFSTQYEHLKTNKKLTVVYTHGLCSDPWGGKPQVVRDFCVENNFSFIRYELAGHGSDVDNILNTDFNVWKNQLLEIIDDFAQGDVLVVGSSLGGWLSLISARERPNRIIGFIGLAPAPDFSYDMEQNVLTEAQKAELDTGILHYPMKDFTYHVTKKMFDTARENLLLQGPLAVKCPVHIIHGTDDKNLDPQKPFKLQNVLESQDVIVKLIKGSNHRLSREVDYAQLRHSLADLTAQYKE